MKIYFNCFYYFVIMFLNDDDDVRYGHCIEEEVTTYRFNVLCKERK
jgi:hypothetical protein